MGDRANIVVRDKGQPQIFLYTHWHGTELPETLRQALARHERWDDSPYLTRIIFCRMVKGQEGDATGFGISTSMCDNEHPLLIVDIEKQQITIENEPGTAGIEGAPKTYTFAEYAALNRTEWGDLETPR
jgi:hypothetical protein